MLSDIILAFAIHSYLQITSKNDSHSTQILKKLFSEITENEKSFSLSENAQRIFQLDSGNGNKNWNSSILVKNRYNQLKNLSDIININLFSFQNQCFELFFDTNVEEFINFYKNAGRHSGLLSKFCISILQKVSVMESGEVGSIQNYLSRIFDFAGQFFLQDSFNLFTYAFLYIFHSSKPSKVLTQPIRKHCIS